MAAARGCGRLGMRCRGTAGWLLRVWCINAVDTLSQKRPFFQHSGRCLRVHQQLYAVRMPGPLTLLALPPAALCLPLCPPLLALVLSAGCCYASCCSVVAAPSRLLYGFLLVLCMCACLLPLSPPADPQAAAVAGTGLQQEARGGSSRVACRPQQLTGAPHPLTGASRDPGEALGRHQQEHLLAHRWDRQRRRGVLRVIVAFWAVLMACCPAPPYQHHSAWSLQHKAYWTPLHPTLLRMSAGVCAATPSPTLPPTAPSTLTPTPTPPQGDFTRPGPGPRPMMTARREFDGPYQQPPPGRHNQPMPGDCRSLQMLVVVALL